MRPGKSGHRLRNVRAGSFSNTIGEHSGARVQVSAKDIPADLGKNDEGAGTGNLSRHVHEGRLHLFFGKAVVRDVHLRWLTRVDGDGESPIHTMNGPRGNLPLGSLRYRVHGNVLLTLRTVSENVIENNGDTSSYDRTQCKKVSRDGRTTTRRPANWPLSRIRPEFKSCATVAATSASLRYESPIRFMISPKVWVAFVVIVISCAATYLSNPHTNNHFRGFAGLEPEQRSEFS